MEEKARRKGVLGAQMGTFLMNISGCMLEMVVGRMSGYVAEFKHDTIELKNCVVDELARVPRKKIQSLELCLRSEICISQFDLRSLHVTAGDFAYIELR